MSSHIANTNMKNIKPNNYNIKANIGSQKNNSKLEKAKLAKTKSK